MLGSLLRVALVTAGAGWAASTVDPQTLHKIMETISGLSGQMSAMQPQPGKIEQPEDVSNVVTRARQAIQGEAARPEPGVFTDLFRHGTEAQEASPSDRKAFFNKLPYDCASEKVIDLNGRVSCSTPGR